MAYTCQLIEGSETAINLILQDPGWTLLNRTMRLGGPEIKETYGGRLQDKLVRREDGKRVMSLALLLQASSDDDLIDRVNALEERLRHAARYRVDGWGDEVFLEFKLDTGTFTIRYPVLSGEIDTSALMQICGVENDAIINVPVTLNCEPYWEADTTYALENYIDNPGFWRGSAPGDSWTEFDVGGVCTVSWETTIWEVMGQSLKCVATHDAVNDVEIRSDNITVVAETDYYVEARVYHTSGCDDIRMGVRDVTNGAWIFTPAAGLVWDEQDDAWEKLGRSFTTPAGCVTIYVSFWRRAVDSSAGTKTWYTDATYLTLGTTAPTGWCSSRNLVNHLDSDADHVNCLVVSDIPGEVAAETTVIMLQADTNSDFHLAKRTRNNPHDFTWEYGGVDAFTKLETGGGGCAPGNIDGTMNDSDKAAAASAPGGCQVEVDFSVIQGMSARCNWQITTNLMNHRGYWGVGILAKKDGSTDTIKMQVRSYQDVILPWQQGLIIEQDVPTATDWELLTGWTVFQFPIGTHDNDLWDTGNKWVIEVHASTDTATPTDELHIAGMYLIPLDEAYLIANGAFLSGAGNIVSIKDLDGDRGAFIQNPGSNIYYSNAGTVGVYPRLEPEIDNWLYFILGSTNEVDITDAMTASISYRPQGIFIRGTNP